MKARPRELLAHWADTIHHQVVLTYTRLVLHCVGFDND